MHRSIYPLLLVSMLGAAASAEAIGFTFQTSITGGDEVPVTVELNEVPAGDAVDVTVSIPPGSGDILGFFGNVLDEELLGAMTASDDAGLVTRSQFAANSVRQVGPGNNLNPVKNWDFGVQIAGPGVPGGNAIETVTFRLSAPGLNDRQLSRAAAKGWVFGVRLQGPGAKLGMRAAAPAVKIQTPSAGMLLNGEPITVSGSLQTPDAAVTVNGVPATLDGKRFSAVVPLVEGVNEIVAVATNDFGSGSDRRTVTLDSTDPAVALSAPADGLATAATAVAVRGTVSDASGLDSLTVNGQSATLGAGGAFDVTVPLVLGPNPITVSARDVAGNVGSVDLQVERGIAPAVVFEAPAQNSVVRASPILVRGRLDGDDASLTIAGQPPELLGDGTFRALVALAPGLNAIAAQATSRFGQASAVLELRFARPPTVRIDDPPRGTLVAQTEIAVGGTVDDAQATVSVNGVAATVVAGTPARWSALVPLAEGTNLLTATATGGDGEMATHTVSVTRDTNPPRLTIGAPAAGAVVEEDAVTVTGLVNDLVVGSVNDEATVTVNGQPATVADRSFAVAGVPLVPGPNQILAEATDRAGNTASAAVTVTLAPRTGARLRKLGGDGQSGPIASLLPDPLVVEALDAGGDPVAGVPVVFRVVENTGAVSADGVSGRSLAVFTDGDGRAQAMWSLGTKAGAGNQRVSAKAARFGEVAFVASGTPAGAAKILVDSGGAQEGVVGQPLPMPLVAVVTDAGNNRLAGVPVTFSVVEGDGSFDGAASVTVLSDRNGAAEASMTLGPRAGIEDQVAEATFAGNAGVPVKFVASGILPGDPATTRISGVVLDNSNDPVAGVSVSLHGAPGVVQTDAEGQFVIAPAPIGNVKLEVDGATAQRPGTWPSLTFDLVTIPGHDNTVGAPIFLLPLDIPNGRLVDETTGASLTLPEMPGFALDIEPGSATFPDGSRSGLVTVTPVHADKVPMPPNFGQQPRLIVTIQPSGVHFDPPARLTLPNVDGLAPGEITELYSFDHDLGQFISIGPGTVSGDGLTVRSNPGVGIVEGGWHCGGNPAAQGACCDCDDCQRCDDGQGTCVPDDSNEPNLPCTTVSVSNELDTATSVAESALSKIPFVDDVEVSGSLNGEGCPGCCDGAVKNPKEVSIRGSVTASASVEKVLSPIDFEVEVEFTVLGVDFEFELEVELGPKVALEPTLSVDVVGSRDLCEGENCLTIRGCGAAVARLGASAGIEIEVEVGIFDVEVNVTAEAFAQAPAVAKVDYSTGAGCDQTGFDVDGCLGDLEGEISVEVLSFSVSWAWTFLEGSDNCECA